MTRATTEVLPVESRVLFRQRDVAGLDRLRVVGSTGYGAYGTNGPITSICISAKVFLDAHHYRRESGCIDDLEQDPDEFVYRFDGVQWMATTTATFHTTTETWATDEKGKGRRFEKGPPASATVELLWKGVGQERNRPWASASSCYLTVICPSAGVERIRDAEMFGAVKLGGLDVAVKFPRDANGTMRWSAGI